METLLAKTEQNNILLDVTVAEINADLFFLSN